MQKLIFISISLLFIGCVTNDDGSSKSTYSSCKITSSSAIFASDRVKDLKQCWNAPNGGYESKGDALAWCASEVTRYTSKYILVPSVEYVIESTYCP